jgi:hypothetical protein
LKELFILHIGGFEISRQVAKCEFQYIVEELTYLVGFLKKQSDMLHLEEEEQTHQRKDVIEVMVLSHVFLLYL